MEENDYGYFGKGMDGYAHYTQAVNDTKSILDSSTRHNSTRDQTEHTPTQQASWSTKELRRAKCILWFAVMLVWCGINAIVALIWGNPNIEDITKRSAQLIYSTFGGFGATIVAIIDIILLGEVIIGILRWGRD